MSKFHNRTALMFITSLSVAIAVLLVAALATATSQEDDVPPAQPLVTPVVGPAGQAGPFNFVIPATVESPGTAQAYGDFRLIPYGYAASLPHTQELPVNLRGQTGELSTTSDQSAVKASWLYKEPAELPTGYKLARVEGLGRGKADYGVVLSYEGPSFPLVIARQAVIQRPIDVHMYPASGNQISTRMVGSIGNVKAIFEKPVPGSKFQSAISIQFVAGGILTSVEWRVVDPTKSEEAFQQILKVAESLLR